MGTELRDRVVALLSHGNKKLAIHEINEQGLNQTDRADFTLLLRNADIRTGYFAPIIVPAAPERSFLWRLEFADGATASDELPAKLATNGREAILAGLNEAWNLVGGTGPRTSVKLDGMLLDALPWLDHVEGESPYLAALLAGVAHYADEPPRWNVIATGRFGTTLEQSVEKARLVQEARAILHIEAGRVASHPSPADPLLRTMTDARAAVEDAFGFVPWHKDAPKVRRVHAHCLTTPRRDAHPGRWGAKYDAKPELPASVSASNIKDALEAVVRACEPDGRMPERLELSLAGPQAVALALGAVLKNKPYPIRFIHSDQPVWSNKVQPRTAPPAAADAGGRWICIRRDMDPSPPSFENHQWKEVVTSNKLPRQEVAEVMRRVLSEIGSAKDVHLGVSVGLGVAFAAGAVSAVPRSLHVYHWNGTAYEPWFTSNAH